MSTRHKKLRLGTHFAIFGRSYEDVNSVHLVLGKGRALKVSLLALAWVQNDALLAVDDVLALLA